MIAALWPLAQQAIPLAPVLPAFGALVVLALLAISRRVSEHLITRIAQVSLWLSFLVQIVALVAFLTQGQQPLDLFLGDFYRAGDYGFELRFYLDGVALSVGPLATVLLLATCRFSAHYLHREPGFSRFFLLTLVFSAGILLLIYAGTYDLLFAGWEFVGLTSVLLVGFFHERQGPVAASLRVLGTYRICDLGLLLAPIALHLSLHSSSFLDLHHALTRHPEQVPVTLVALLLVLSAIGKSAQFPVGGWLPRAMEGPTASSAVFYGGLSVHAGVYLLIRSAPLFAHAPIASAVVVAIGAITAVMAALSGQVSADAKTALAYATISQVGILFIECGLGFPRLATVHLCAHALLRYYQFLRTPSALQDALAQRAALGRVVAERWQRAPIGLRRAVFRLAIERFEVEASVDRWLVRPVTAVSIWITRLEDRALALLASAPSPVAPSPAPKEPTP